MKIHQTEYDLSFYVYIPSFILVCVVYYFEGDWLAKCYNIHWVLAPMLVYALATKVSEGSFLQYDENAPSNWSSHYKTILFSAALACLFCASAQIFSIPAQQPHILFPFDFYALLAIVMAGVQRMQKKGLLSSAVFFWFSDEYNQATGVMTDSYARVTNLLCLSCTAFVMTLLVQEMLAKFSLIAPLRSLNTGTAISMTATLSLVTMNSDSFRVGMRKVINFFPLWLVVPVCAFFILAFNLVVAHFVQTNITRELIHFDYFEHWRSVSNHSVLYNMFLVSWGLIYCGFVCHVSQGKPVRQTLLISLCTAIAAQFLFQTINQSLLYSCAIVSALGLLITFIRPRYISNINRVTMMSESWFKQRPAYTFVSTIVLLCAVFFGGYITTQATGLGYLMELATMPTMMLMLMGLVNIFLTS